MRENAIEIQTKRQRAVKGSVRMAKKTRSVVKYKDISRSGSG